MQVLYFFSQKMVPHGKVHTFYKSLDTTCVPPFHIDTSFETWAHVYNHTFKEYMRLRKEGYLNTFEAHKLMGLMMKHVIANTERYKV